MRRRLRSDHDETANAARVAQRYSLGDPVQTLRLRLKQGERVAPYPLPPLRLYPPVRLSRTLRYPRADVACGYRVVRGVLLAHEHAVGPLPVESRLRGGHFRPRKELFRPEGEEHVPGDRR